MGEVNENVDTDEVLVDCPNTAGILLVELVVCDAPKENKGSGDGELADEPNGFGGGTDEKGKLVLLREVVPEPNGFAGGTDEPVAGTLAVKDDPDVPNIVDEPDEPNWKGAPCVTVDVPVVGSD